MGRALLLIGWLGAVAHADDRAPMKNGHYSDHEKAWSKLSILNLKLGGKLGGQAGFTCGPPPGTDGFTTQNHGCVKFVDDRCKGRVTKIHHIRSSADVPAGQACFMDEFTGATYLDRKLLEPPLKAVHIIGTDTSAPLVFRIEYTFAADDLTADSTLGKALIAKYGPPTSTNPPIGMSWAIDDTTLYASCRSTVGAIGEYCRLVVEDGKLDETERSIQHQANDDARKQKAPPPPPL